MLNLVVGSLWAGRQSLTKGNVIELDLSRLSLGRVPTERKLACFARGAVVRDPRYAVNRSDDPIPRLVGFPLRTEASHLGPIPTDFLVGHKVRRRGVGYTPQGRVSTQVALLLGWVRKLPFSNRPQRESYHKRLAV